MGSSSAASGQRQQRQRDRDEADPGPLATAELEAEEALGEHRQVKEPIAAEYRHLRADQVLFTYLHLAADRPLTEALIASGTTAVAYETVEDVAGRLPLLAPMSEVAGRLAAQAGAYFLQDPLGGRGLLVGGVPGVAPARVLVLGGGVVGTQAARVAVGMGAEVTILDRSLRRLRELDELFDGRARVVMSTAAQIEDELERADVVIGAVLVPGAAAPKLVTREMLTQLPPRAVLVDVAIDQGGSFATSRPTTHAEPTFVVDDVLHYCVANMPGAVPRTSTPALTNATLPYVRRRSRPRRPHRAGPGRRARRQRARRRAGQRTGRRHLRSDRGGVNMATTTNTYRNVVGGELVDAVDGGTREVLNPATGDVLARVPEGDGADVEQAVDAARKARVAWRDTTPGRRQELLLALADVVADHADELAALQSANVGKPSSLAGEELPICVDELRFFAGAARTGHAPAAGEYGDGHTSLVRREPLGIVAQIAPWNYPLMMAIWKIGPALAAGNVVVLKPSELTPLTTLRLAELAADVLPTGVLNVITGDGPSVGEPLVRHRDIAMVSLTGSVTTGKGIARAAADTLKRLHLELGGKAPVVVPDDADVQAVADALRVASFCNSGQDCTAASRVIATAGAHDALLEALVLAASSLLSTTRPPAKPSKWGR
jgi:alanine dehydrogenase